MEEVGQYAGSFNNTVGNFRADLQSSVVHLPELGEIAEACSGEMVSKHTDPKEGRVK